MNVFNRSQPTLNFFIRDTEGQSAVRNINDDLVPLFHSGDGAACGGFGGDVADAGSACGAGEAPIGNQGAVLIHSPSHDEGAGHVHLPHPRSTLWPLIADDQHISLLDLVVGNRVAGVLHGGKHSGPAFEIVHTGLDPRLFDHRPVGSQVAVEDRQSPFWTLGAL